MDAAPKPTQVQIPGVVTELDVTPRWFALGPSFYEDLADIARSIGTYEGAAHRLFADVSIGLTGVRVVIQVPSGNATDALAAERDALKAHFDALDLVNPRRRRVTEQRAATAQKAAEEAAAKQEQPSPAEADTGANGAAKPVAAELEAASPPA